MTFSHDRDLLIFEPRLFAELAWPGQVLARGSDGQLSGTTFNSASGGFVAAGLAAGMVLTITGPAAGPWPVPAALEIVTVTSATQLTVSAIRAEPAAANSTGGTIAPRLAATTGLAWHVVSFGPQAETVGLEMTARFGLSPADPASRWSAGDIVSPESLRTLSACGVLATLLAGAAGRGDPSDGYWAKAAHYRGLFDRLMSRVRIGLDRGDGRTAKSADMAAPRLRRD